MSAGEESQYPASCSEEEALVALKRVVERWEAGKRLLDSPDFKEVVLEGYLAGMKDLEGRILDSVRQRNKEARRLSTKEWREKMAFRDYLEGLKHDAEKAQEYLTAFYQQKERGDE